MTRTVVLGLLGLAAAVAIGVAIHLVTRDTIALPVVRLDQGGASLTPAATTIHPETRPSSTTGTRPATTAVSGTVTGAATTDDDSGRGRGRGRGGGGGDD